MSYVLNSYLLTYLLTVFINTTYCDPKYIHSQHFHVHNDISGNSQFPLEIDESEILQVK